jgi:hypothetical protein
MSSTSLCLKRNKIGFGALKVKKKLGQPKICTAVYLKTKCKNYTDINERVQNTGYAQKASPNMSYF